MSFWPREGEAAIDWYYRMDKSRFWTQIQRFYDKLQVNPTVVSRLGANRGTGFGDLLYIELGVL